MIGKVSRGDRMAGLMVYLAGPGRANEHTDPHLVAGDGAVMAWHNDDELNRDSALAIAKHLEQPAKVFDTDVKGGHVWQCSLSLRQSEGELTDQQWSQIANEFVQKMGYGDDGVKAPTRWAAVRHGLSSKGNDHIHIVVNLVREDGTKASISNDYHRVAKACRELEAKHNLEPVLGRHVGRGSRGYTFGELQAAARRQAFDTYTGEGHNTPWAQLPPTDREQRVAAAQEQVQLPRYQLRRRVRGVAATSSSEAEFVRRLRGSGLLTRPRFASGTKDVITGYSVAFRPEAGQKPIWYGGGQLSRDLALPRLREQWPDTPQAASEAATEWQAAWRGQPVVNPGPESVNDIDPETWSRCEADLANWRQALRDVPPEDRAQWATVARDAAGAFAAWSQQVETTPGPLAAAADALARSAELRKSVEQPKPAGQVGAYGAAMILAVATGKGKSMAQQAMILRQLMNLTKALYDMHQAEGDAARAAELASIARNELATVAAGLPDPDLPAGPTPQPDRDPGVRGDTEALPSPIPGKLDQDTDRPERDQDTEAEEATRTARQGQTPWNRQGSGPTAVKDKWVRKGRNRGNDRDMER